MLPKDISQPLNKIKSPEGRLLITCLIMALMFVFGLWVSQIRRNGSDCDKEKARLQGVIDAKLGIIERKDLKIDSMRMDAYFKSEEERRRLIKRDAYLDSLSAINKYINNKLKK